MANKDLSHDSIIFNWQHGRYKKIKKIYCKTEVYCIQFDDEKIISGMGDHTVRIYDRNNLETPRILKGHTGIVMCLKYDEKIIISGSTDGTIRIWDIQSEKVINTLMHQNKPYNCIIFQLYYNNNTIITSLSGGIIWIWDMTSPENVKLRDILNVNLKRNISYRISVAFDKNSIINTDHEIIKLWKISDCKSIGQLEGHENLITCLDYQNGIVITGTINEIRIWDFEKRECMRVLKGHEFWSHSIKFDNKRIVCGGYWGEITVWVFKNLSDPQSDYIVESYERHRSMVYLQFNNFEIVSGSFDKTIKICDYRC
jgi:WD40 repeat protein